ncbi:MAG: AAA family ATPase, partial [Thermodesulfobacteriota bacterium]
MRTTHPGVRGGSSSLTPRARFLYPSETYQEAYLKLLDCLHQRRGVAVLTGEAGTGKTTLLRHVLAACEADPSVRCLFFAYPCLTYGELVSFICEDLQLDGTGEGEDGQKLDTLLHCLRERAQRGETVVLLLDEAHSLPEDVLAQLPLLVGASPTAPPLQLVLCGWSPAFEEMLWRPRLAPLRQRVSVHCRLEPLTAAEIPPFIRARLAAAGYEGRNAVRPDALRLIARYSAGVPRTIVTICDKILQAAHLSGRQDLSAELVRQVARDLRLEEPEGGARLGPEGKESTTAPADARQEEDAPAGEPGQPGFRLFARRLRTPSVVRLGEIVIALLAFWLVAHTSRVAETVPPQPQVHSPSRAASGARPDAPNPARGGYVHIPVTQAVPAPPSPVSFPAHVQTAERGHALFQTLARRYPKIRPFLWGAMTERPMIALFLPEAEWVALSEAEQGSLVLYLASLIPAAKVEPDPYIDAFRTEPGYPALRAKVAHMCA